jgi:hypothetical protein
VNKLYSDSIFEKGYILIPVTNWAGPMVKKDDVEDRKMLVKRFSLICKVVDVDEAWSYMRRCDFDLDHAVKEYMGDIEWEEQNPFKGIPRHPNTATTLPLIDRRPKKNIFSTLTRSSTYNMLTFSKTKKSHPSATPTPPVTLKDTDTTSIASRGSDSTVKSWKRILTRNRTF